MGSKDSPEYMPTQKEAEKKEKREGGKAKRVSLSHLRYLDQRNSAKGKT